MKQNSYRNFVFGFRTKIISPKTLKTTFSYMFVINKMYFKKDLKFFVHFSGYGMKLTQPKVRAIK